MGSWNDVGSPNATTTDSLHGKMGTDAEMGDTSLYDMLIAGLPQQASRATDTLPQTTAEALFTITGTIELLAIVGEVTTAIQNQANATKLTFNPTGAGASTDLCAALDIDNDAAGVLYTISGDFSDAMLEGVWCAERTSTANTSKGVILGAGTIDLDCAASNTGNIQWFVLWRPIESGSTVTATAV